MSKIRTYESNSQLALLIDRFRIGCSWCQRYELMRAIHNLGRLTLSMWIVVPDVKDTNLWEQFTTPLCILLFKSLLFLMSKIRTYESNSQLDLNKLWTEYGCSWCQRYELMRAIHNLWNWMLTTLTVVPDVKDTNLWEQFTTKSALLHFYASCSWCQRYELMRAIHNIPSCCGVSINVVPDVKDTNLWEQFTTITT